MAETELRTVRITPEEDRQLEAVAPEYLKGGRRIEQRVRWAIAEFLEAYHQQHTDPTTPAQP